MDVKQLAVLGILLCSLVHIVVSQAVDCGTSSCQNGGTCDDGGTANDTSDDSCACAVGYGGGSCDIECSTGCSACTTATACTACLAGYSLASGTCTAVVTTASPVVQTTQAGSAPLSSTLVTLILASGILVWLRLYM